VTLSRREWLGSILGASLAGAIAPLGCVAGEREAPRFDGELLGPSFARGHTLRAAPRPITETIAHDAPVPDVIIAGGGVAGLAAARALRGAGLDDLRVLELEDEVGGTAIGGVSSGIPHPWGAHYLPTPAPDDTALVGLLDEMGLVTGRDARGRPRYDEARLVREPEERLYYRGRWYPGLYPAIGETPAERTERLRFDAQMRAFARRRDAAGRRAFASPVDASARDEDLLALDRVSATAWLAAQGYRSRRLAWFCDYACRDDFGLTLAQTSAWALVHYFAARLHGNDDPSDDGRSDDHGDDHGDADSAPLLTWPDGNFALVRHLRARVGTARLRTGALVSRLVDGPDHVTVHAEDARTGAPSALRARRVVLAVPHFVAQRLVPDLAPIAHATHGAWVVANLTLRDRPDSPGFPLAWDNVLHDSPSLGYVVATHAAGRDHGPTVWTYYLPLTDDDPRDARRKLLEHPLAHWQDAVYADLARAHRDLRAHTARIDVYRFGHAMVQPRVGALFSGDRVTAQAPRGRIHFAHSDLSGLALFEEAFHQGLRAAAEVRAALRPT